MRQTGHHCAVSTTWTLILSTAFAGLRTLAPLLGGCGLVQNWAEDQDLTHVDKSSYNLFHPTPQLLLREMEALYENPYTVDAGHAQVETYPFGYRLHRERVDGQTRVSDGWTFAPTNLRIGILNHVDLQLAFAPYTTLSIKDATSHASERHQGFGDLVARTRVNLWGNDGGKTAGALTPFCEDSHQPGRPWK